MFYKEILTMTSKEKIIDIIISADENDMMIIYDTFITFLAELPEERAEHLLHLLSEPRRAG